ncbi:hypothetical protein P691DRAFT_779493 [Macrolepiota fuliginosa MF-IS2]|uniref:2'-phosphotransferase n=1 Tax=Macrolepiota fuliginosa MF-IS2 TaxID=1400762 RepID=A0A9P6BY23_9AGAR|nr:hypothetical protein P691DRAFT_779493 [Macrolepiota fuliginosa MF-IS2]
MAESVPPTPPAPFQSDLQSRQHTKPKQTKQKQQDPPKQGRSGGRQGPRVGTSGSGSDGINAPGGSQKLRGFGKDKPEVRVSKTLSWLLRHGAASEGLAMRADGYVKVDDLFKNGRIQPLGLTMEQLKGIVSADSKQRYTLVYEQADGTALAYTAVQGKAEGEGVWLIKANQGHSLKAVELELKPILSVSDIPSGLAVHGTTNAAWVAIQKEGLSRMKRNHIHLAQDVGGDNVISGMRRSSQILIFIHVQKALDAGIKFYLSDNGVVLTEGDETGYLKTKFFDRVEIAKTRIAVDGWEGGRETDNPAVAT